MKNPFEFLSRRSKAPPSSEKRPHPLQERLKEPNYLPPYEGLKKLAEGLTDEHGRFDSLADTVRWGEFLDNEHVYEIFTREYIEKFANYLSERIQTLAKDKQPLVVLEVGAGNGKLTRFLRER